MKLKTLKEAKYYIHPVMTWVKDIIDGKIRTTYSDWRHDIDERSISVISKALTAEYGTPHKPVGSYDCWTIPYEGRGYYSVCLSKGSNAQVAVTPIEFDGLAPGQHYTTRYSTR